MSEECLNWHNGCKNDPVRNNFIIPFILGQIDRFHPSNLIDVGAGTGYIASRIIEMQGTCRHLTLADTSAERIAFSQALPSLTNAKFLLGDFFDERPLTTERFDLVLLSNVLLEVKATRQNITRIKSTLSINGRVVVTHPDTLFDLIDSHPQISADLISNYTSEGVSLSKVDKFTGDPYPFNAHRVSTLIELFIAEGLRLTDFQRNPTAGNYLALVFER